MANDRLNEIDLLRFIAACSVVFFHYCFLSYTTGYSTVAYPFLEPIAKYGYLGVVLFFMISGFVILLTAASGCLKKFIISRVVRLYPAFWFCCTVTFICILIGGGEKHHATFGQYILNMTMLGNYFGSPTIDGVYWSLYVEIKFYALMSLVLIFRSIHRIEPMMYLWLLLSVILEILPVKGLRYILCADFSTYFIAGAVLYLIWANGITVSRATLYFASWIFAITQSIWGSFGFGIQKLNSLYNTTLNPWIVTGIISSFFIVMGLIALRRTGSLGQHRWIAIGALTYPLYLLHERVGQIVMNSLHPHIPPYMLLLGISLSMLYGAYLVNIYVEKKFSPCLNTRLSNIVNYVSKRCSTSVQSSNSP